MRFVIIHSQYKQLGGEESIVQMQYTALVNAGHQVTLYQRQYQEIGKWKFRPLSALFSALYNRRAVKKINQIIKTTKPEVALIHNIYPLMSGAIIPKLHKAGVKTLLFTHNYRLLCPVGTCFTKNQTCTQCATSATKEWRCVVNKCEGSLTGSIAFALRNWWSRRQKYTSTQMDRYCVLSEFQAQILSQAGYDKHKMAILPNAINNATLPNLTTAHQREGVGMVGRFTVEKGSALIAKLAQRMPHTNFYIAGAFDKKTTSELPQNIIFCGVLNGDQLADFYSKMEIVISASIVWETFGLTIIEAMHYGAVVAVPDLASMGELVDHGRCGKIYRAASLDSLQNTVQELLNNKPLCQQLARSAKQRVERVYDTKRYVDQLIKIIDSINQ